MAKLRNIVGKITDTEGVCLRYLVSVVNPVKPTRLVNHIHWSPLPHSYLAARTALESLVEMQLAKKQGKLGYTYTELGKSAIKYADNKGLWEKPIAEADSRRYK